MQGEENGATTESKKTLWVLLQDPQHVLRSVDFVIRPDNTFEPVNQFKNRTIGALQHEWENKLLFRCRLEDHPDYQAPKAEPLRWVKNCKPDKPGLWARPGATVSIGAVTVVTTESLQRSSWGPVTRCYLGPIPEILPPKKEVVQRLWLLRSGSCGHGCSAYYEHWLGYDEQPTESGDWIHTDRTREVEQ